MKEIKQKKNSIVAPIILLTFIGLCSIFNLPTKLIENLEMNDASSNLATISIVGFIYVAIAIYGIIVAVKSQNIPFFFFSATPFFYIAATFFVWITNFCINNSNCDIVVQKASTELFIIKLIIFSISLIPLGIAIYKNKK